MVVLPEPVPPEMTILNRDAPAIFNAVHIFWFIAPHWARLSSVIGLAENLRMEIAVPRRLSGGTITLTRLPYFKRRSEERRGGDECVSTCRSRGAPDH